MELTFLGAAGTVTGSKFLIQHQQKTILVDCGLFQGYKKLRQQNWEPFPVAPSSIDAVLLTHAHIDHSGYIPLLIKNGFQGPIYASRATIDLCSILLPDSGHIHEEDARRANKYRYSKHSPALPLYTEEEAKQSLKYFEGVDFGQVYPLAKDQEELSFTFSRAGHILGSAIVTLSSYDARLVFTGDLGRPHDHLMNPPATIQTADYLILESTYGNSMHDTTDPIDQIRDVIQKTVARGGSVIIPAFAVGRTQHLLYYLEQLKNSGQIPNIPIYLDSPLAINATEILCRHAHEHKLSDQQCQKTSAIAKYIHTPEASAELDRSHLPSIIISASGMATGGRILHHLEHFAPDHHHTILLTGFQAGGTRGDRLLRGEREIKIHGNIVPIRAQVENLTNSSAHADSEEILSWLRKFTSPPKKVFLVHGEGSASEALKLRIEEEFGWPVFIPAQGQKEVL